MEKEQRTKSGKHRGLRKLAVGVLVFGIILVGVRLYLPTFVRNYVNRTLDRNPLYKGSIGAVNIHLWRGAYSIHDIQISKTTGDVPVPLFAAERVDFAMEWKALLHHKIVGQIALEGPQLNFVDAPTEGDTQTGSGGPWLDMIRDLFPFRINSATLANGSVHFRTYKGTSPVDVYLSQLKGSIDNLSNVRDDTTPMAATVQASAKAMDQANLDFKMTLDPFSYRPTFHLGLRLLGLDVTKINDLALSYGKFDFKRGWFDLVVEADSKEGQMTGYVKPLFRDLQVFSVTEDLKDGNIIQFFWQALVGAATRVLRNQQRDQFGTLIPFSGDASGSTTTDILATVGNILRNAFVRAYLPKLENGQETVEGMTFSAPDFTESIATSDTAQ